MKLVISIILLFCNIGAFCQTDTLITPQLRYEIKRKIIKHRFAKNALDYMKNAYDEAGNFVGNKNILSTRKYRRGDSGIQDIPGFGYGFNKDLSVEIVPLDWGNPDTTWHLYKVKFKLNPKLDLIRGIFKDISNWVKDIDWYYIVAINKDREIRYITNEFHHTENKLSEFFHEGNQYEPSSFVSWIGFWLINHCQMKGLENIKYWKEEDEKYWYQVVYGDSLNFEEVILSFPKKNYKNINFNVTHSEKYIAPKPPYYYGFGNEHIRDRYLKDNVMKNIYIYQLGKVLSPNAIKVELDNYFVSDNSVLDSIIPDFDEVFYYGMHVNPRPVTPAILGSDADVFAPKCKVLTKSWDIAEHYHVLFQKTNYPLYRLDGKNCLDWSINGLPARLEEMNRKRKKDDDERRATAYKATIKKYEEKMKSWPADKPKPPPPPPEPPLRPIEDFQPSIYKPNSHEEYYPEKERYIVSFNRDSHNILFLSGKDIFLDPLFGYLFNYSQRTYIEIPACCEDKLLIENEKQSEKYWKDYAVLRLLAYSTPSLYIKGYLDYYSVVELNMEKVVIETYGLKPGTPWTDAPVYSEEFTATFNFIIRGEKEKPYDFIHYSPSDRVKLRMTINYQDDYEWFTVEEIE